MTVYTLKTLAQRWDCSERNVRNILNRGELRFFRLGGTLIRVPGEAVEEYERCHTQSDATGEGSASSTTGTGRDTAALSADVVQKLKLKALRQQFGRT
jgi:excisionase family DNA binding protein